MNFRTLQVYVALCENDYHVTKTAESLHLAQPAVSKAIKELETYYGVTLFDRFGKKLSITSVGERLLKYSKLILSSYDDLEREFRNWDSIGELRIGVSSSIGVYHLPALLKSFTNQYPNLYIRTQINESSVLEEMILNNSIDIALIEGVVHHDEIKSEAFMEDELTLICSNERYKDGTILTKEEFEREPFLTRDRESGTREVFLSKLDEANIIPDIRIESVSTEALLRCVYANLGIAVIPRRIANRAHRTGRASIIGLEGINMKRRYLIIYHKNKYLSQSALQFIEECKILED